jgi:hypothetical protein
MSQSCPGDDGDDTAHSALPYFQIPDYVASNEPQVEDDAEIDLVFLDYIEDDVLEILNEVQSEKVYTTGDLISYSELYTNEVLGVYAQQAWN